jgi:hypothetical protein
LKGNEDEKYTTEEVEVERKNREMYEENMKENTKHRDRKNKTKTRNVEKQE